MYFVLDKYFIRQCLINLFVQIDMFILGAGFTYSATLLPQLQAVDSDIRITENQGIWIASLPSLSCLLGPPIANLLLELCGRKWSYVLVAFANIASWGIIATSADLTQILCGRAMQGITAGIAFPVSYCFLTEAIPPQHRSVLLNLYNISLAAGTLFVDLMGSRFSWRLSAYILTTLSALYLTLILYLRNTYVWYLNRNRLQDARNSYFWYKIENKVNIDVFEQEVTEVARTAKISVDELLAEYKRREFYMPLFVLFWLYTTALCTGGYSIMLYSVQIMQNVVDIDEYLTTIIIDVLRVLCGLLSFGLLAYVPIRWVINASSMVCAMALMAISAALRWRAQWPDGCSWVALIAIFVYNVFFNLTFVNNLNVLSGELFTGIGKPTGLSLMTMYFYALNFAMGHAVPNMFSTIGYDGTFLAFAVCMIVGGIGIYFIVPETKNISFEQIRKNFQKRSKN